MRHPTYTIMSWLLAACVFLMVHAYFSPGGRTLVLPTGDVDTVEVSHAEMLEALEELAPLGYTVELTAYDDPTASAWGWTEWNDELELFEMHVHADAQAETVLHEYVHAMLWDLPMEQDHGPVFWAMYGELYRALIEE